MGYIYEWKNKATGESVSLIEIRGEVLKKIIEVSDARNEPAYEWDWITVGFMAQDVLVPYMIKHKRTGVVETDDIKAYLIGRDESADRVEVFSGVINTIMKGRVFTASYGR